MLSIKDRLRIMAQIDEINRLRAAQFAAEERKREAASLIRALADEAGQAQRQAANVASPYTDNHPCVIAAQQVTAVYNAAYYTYQILTGELP